MPSAVLEFMRQAAKEEIDQAKIEVADRKMQVALLIDQYEKLKAENVKLKTQLSLLKEDDRALIEGIGPAKAEAQTQPIYAPKRKFPVKKTA